MAIQKPRRRNTVSQAKNLMRRAVAEIVDPSPTDVGPVWDYFENHCAYCGAAKTRCADRTYRSCDAWRRKPPWQPRPSLPEVQRGRKAR